MSASPPTLGYKKVYQVLESGEFPQRGEIIDVFPINLEEAIRFEFLGNKIEEVSTLPIKIEDEEKSKEILKRS